MPRKLVVVSNRLPIVMQAENGAYRFKPGGGGLVQALDPLLRDRGGVWVGWPGAAVDDREQLSALIAAEGQKRGYRFAPVFLDPELASRFYAGFANGVLWPLFHNIDKVGSFDPAHWQAYKAANRCFAQAVRASRAGGLTWVHDYQLLGVGERLVRSAAAHDVAFFLHIPFPQYESFVKLPWRDEILRSLLAYRLVGFQSQRDRLAFADCVARMLPQARMTHSDGDGSRDASLVIELRGRLCEVGVFPVGIDFQTVDARARSRAVADRAAELRRELGDRDIVLGADRLDYTKGIPQRLSAFRALLERAPELREKVTLVQLIEPSREEVPEYQELKVELDRQIGAINGELGTTSWMPVQYLYRMMNPVDLSALFRLARVALVTPLRDGMNLVAKEYCASQNDGAGVLVLSEFAGAAAQLGSNALVVNPYDIDATAAALHRALQMPADERDRRMKALRDNAAAEDVFWWSRRFLEAAERTCGTRAVAEDRPSSSISS